MVKGTMMNAVHVECYVSGKTHASRRRFKQCSLASWFSSREEVLLHRDLNGTD